ncbi:pilus assembly protein [Croceibacterium mercuriale]|uniref:Pilus assembly protein n=1 Tax=Croceibacterium mercuriale TaxID=1572751 RepID=A0A0B2BWH5_9SPHN|nr:pilus assembly protein [Croceibacterium mercuriale]
MCRLGVLLSAVASLPLAVVPANANVGTELNTFFNDMGGAANATGPTAYEGQSAGYYSGGSVWTRFPQRNVTPATLNLPSVKAGCGGIDVFSGSFSFINSDEIVAMLKATANNALGFAFQLAIKSISPQISSTIEEFAQKVQQMNQFNMSSCEMAQGLVGGLWGKAQGRDSEICKAIANSQGWATDWAKGRQQCNGGGEREEIIDSNSDEALSAESTNYTWHMLKTTYPSFSKEFREYLMSLVGTVIFDRDGNEGNGSYRYEGIGDQALLTALLTGSTDGTTMLRCDDDDCINPTRQALNVSPTVALQNRVFTMIQSMDGKVRTDAALTTDEIGLLGATSVPLYKIITVNSAAKLGGMSHAEMQGLAEIVAVDMLEVIADQFHSYSSQGSASFQRADPDSLAQWRAQIAQAREIMNERGQQMNERLVRTQGVIERTLFLERTLRNSISPQMSAALSFSRSMSSQGIQ